MLKQMNALNNLGESIDDILYNFLVILGRFLAFLVASRKLFMGILTLVGLFYLQFRSQLVLQRFHLHMVGIKILFLVQ